jgi:AraC family transcriptional regulator, regulatory protein of adaptative response / methylated-DNA-[protein]-cysteine methyltransferase
MNTQTLPYEMRRPVSNNGTSDPRWEAVLARDAASDGKFVYAVRSTKVYCRPVCPSRRPRRNQVEFFSAPALAESAGFRACRRCKPNAALTELDAASAAESAVVSRVCREIERNDEGVPNLSALSKLAGTSTHSLLRLFRRRMGITPRQYADAVRLRRLKTSLKKGSDVTTALYGAGYGSSSRLYERADAQLGMTPSTYRNGGRGMKIAYTIEPSAVGRLLVGATERGISAVYLGDRDRALESELRKEYPRAELRRDSNSLGSWVRQITSHLKGASKSLNLPVDVQATAFQRRVWEELRKIPYGSTRSYHQIAAAIGSPRATRAVANACGANRVAIVVPCHRVVRQDGALSGYRWGAERKRALLANEKRARGKSAA